MHRQTASRQRSRQMAPLARAFVRSVGVAAGWMGLVRGLRHVGALGSADARKALHCGIGPLFCACWRLFPAGAAGAAPSLWAAAIPGGITAYTAAVGLGVVPDRGTVDSMSRHGRRRELLSGPLAYGVCHVLAAAVWWLESPHGVVAIAALCAGDGLAEVVGRRWGKKSGALPWNADKSWAGSAACAVASLGASIALLRWHGLAHPVLPLAAVSLGSTALESLAWEEWDNVAVFAGALVLSHLCLR